MPALFDQGFFVREPAWHGEGIVLADYPGREEAIRLAGHDFRVLERDVFVGTPFVNDAKRPSIVHGKAEGWKALVRDDNDRVLSLVRNSYEVIQNDVPWDVLDAILTQPNVKYETGGTLDDGAVLWALAKIDEPSTIPNDPSVLYPFVASTWSHDGTTAFRVMRVTVRIVCMNTYRAAEGEAQRTGRVFTFRHTKNVMQRIDEAREALAGIRRGHEAFLELARELADLPVSNEGLEAFTKAFIPMPPEHMISERVRGNVEDARAQVRSYLNSATTEGIRNTAWGLFNAGVEYLDYGRAFRSNHTLLNRTLLRPERAKDELLGLVKRTATAFAA